MSARFTQSFKIQAVEKDVANDLGVGYSTIKQMNALALQQKLEAKQDNEDTRITVDKRPQKRV